MTADKELYESKYQISEELTLQEAEKFLREAPIETTNVIERLRFGLTGVLLRPLFINDKRLITNALKALFFLQETEELHKQIDLELKDAPDPVARKIASKRVLSQSERDYLLDLTRASNVPKITTALIMTSLENITFADQGYNAVRKDAEFLEKADWGEIREALSIAGLYPLNKSDEYKVGKSVSEELKVLSTLDESSISKLVKTLDEDGPNIPGDPVQESEEEKPTAASETPHVNTDEEAEPDIKIHVNVEEKQAKGFNYDSIPESDLSGLSDSTKKEMAKAHVKAVNEALREKGDKEETRELPCCEEYLKHGIHSHEAPQFDEAKEDDEKTNPEPIKEQTIRIDGINISEEDEDDEEPELCSICDEPKHNHEWKHTPEEYEPKPVEPEEEVNEKSSSVKTKKISWD